MWRNRLLCECRICTVFMFGVQALTSSLPTRKHQAQHIREWGVIINASEPTGGCWCGGMAYEMLYEQEQQRGQQLAAKLSDQEDALDILYVTVRRVCQVNLSWVPKLASSSVRFSTNVWREGLAVFQFIPDVLDGIKIRTPGQSTSSTPNPESLFFMALALCAQTLSCWNRKGPSPNCCAKLNAYYCLKYHCML